MQKEIFRVHNLIRAPRGGWTWSIIFDPGHRQQEFYYATNKIGKGLWGSRRIVTDPSLPTIRLIRSEEAFSLPSGRQGALRTIREFFTILHQEALAKEAADKAAKEAQNVAPTVTDSPAV